MRDKDKELYPEFDGADDYAPQGGYDLEDILNEDFSTDGAPSEPEGDAAEPLPEPLPDTGDAEPATGRSAPRKKDPRRRTNPLKDRTPEKDEDDENDDEVDDGDDYKDDGDEDGEERPPLKIPNISVKALGLLAVVTLAAVLICVVVRFDVAGGARTALLVAGIAAACIPMLFMGREILHDRDRIPAPLLMALAVILLAASGDIIEALVAAVFYDLCHAAMEYFTHRELGLMESRLLKKSGEAERPLAQRLEAISREAAYKRIKPIVSARALEKLVVFAILILTAVISVIVPLVDGMSFGKWVARGGALLAVCVYTGEAGALMTFLNAADTAAEDGIYFSGSAAVTAATQITSVLFNKSGTLTDGNYRVVNVDPVRLSNEQLLYLAVCAGAWSDHPLARAIREYAGIEPEKARFTRHTEREGYGSMVALEGGQIVAAGNIDFMEELGVRGDMYIPGETCVFVAVGRTCVGRIDLADELKPDAVTVVHELRRLKVANVALMTGDNALNATNTGRRLGIAEVYSDCRPKDKVERLQYILDSQEPDDRLLVVSSSGRDKEIMEMANLSATLGMGDDVTDAYPDIVITSGKLTDLIRTIRVSKRVRADLTAGFAVASFARILCVVLALAGVLGLWGVTALMLAVELVTFLVSFVSGK